MQNKLILVQGVSKQLTYSNSCISLPNKHIYKN